jgi:hypothetical protein
MTRNPTAGGRVRDGRVVWDVSWRTALLGRSSLPPQTHSSHHSTCVRRLVAQVLLDALVPHADTEAAAADEPVCIFSEVRYMRLSRTCLCASSSARCGAQLVTSVQPRPCACSFAGRILQRGPNFLAPCPVTRPALPPDRWALLRLAGDSTLRCTRDTCSWEARCEGGTAWVRLHRSTLPALPASSTHVAGLLHIGH